MELVDTEKANAIILATSKGSRFFNKQARQDARTGEKIRQMQHRRELLNECDQSQALADMDMLASSLEAGRDLSRTLVLVVGFFSKLNYYLYKKIFTVFFLN